MIFDDALIPYVEKIRNEHPEITEERTIEVMAERLWTSDLQNGTLLTETENPVISVDDELLLAAADRLCGCASQRQATDMAALDRDEDFTDGIPDERAVKRVFMLNRLAQLFAAGCRGVRVERYAAVNPRRRSAFARLIAYEPFAIYDKARFIYSEMFRATDRFAFTIGRDGKPRATFIVDNCWKS